MPEGRPGPQQISDYARHLRVVELNASHYRLLPARNMPPGRSAPRDGFGFDVRLCQLTRRGRQTPPTPGGGQAFAVAMQPLRDASRLERCTLGWHCVSPSRAPTLVTLQISGAYLPTHCRSGFATAHSSSQLR
ncbi:MAG: DUF72 domain-containing protein [Chloroflexi bacterium]|nr:DUF72 domain-containing protein [Chloroflexota bacterium]